MCGSVEEAIVGGARGRDVEDQRRACRARMCSLWNVFSLGMWKITDKRAALALALQAYSQMHNQVEPTCLLAKDGDLIQYKRDLVQYKRDLVQYQGDLVQYKRDTYPSSCQRRRPNTVQKRPNTAQKRPSTVPKRPSTVQTRTYPSSCQRRREARPAADLQNSCAVYRDFGA